MPREIRFGEHRVGDGHECFVIAEVGHNHQGDPELAKLMIKSAKDAGASAVKLQKRDLKSLLTDDFAKEPNPGPHSFGETYLEHRQALELSDDTWAELAQYASAVGITLFGTAFDIPSANFLASIGTPMIKVASGDALNWPLLDHLSSLRVPMIVSTGGVTWDELDATVARLRSAKAEFALLQCTAAYPCPPESLRLRAIQAMHARYPGIVIGYSGHEEGIIPTFGAIALGAAIVERHFTTDRSLKGSDHRYSLMPADLAAVVEGGRRLRPALSDQKGVVKEEASALRKLGKKLVIARDLPRGWTLRSEDVEVRSPGDGLPPRYFEQVIGRALKHDMERHADLSWSALI